MVRRPCLILFDWWEQRTQRAHSRLARQLAVWLDRSSSFSLKHCDRANLLGSGRPWRAAADASGEGALALAKRACETLSHSQKRAWAGTSPAATVTSPGKKRMVVDPDGGPFVVLLCEE